MDMEESYRIRYRSKTLSTKYRKGRVFERGIFEPFKLSVRILEQIFDRSSSIEECIDCFWNHMLVNGSQKSSINLVNNN